MSEKKDHSISVISLGEDGPIGNEIKNIGIPVTILGWSSQYPKPSQWLTLIKVLMKESPDILQTWMYHADFVGGICGKLAGVKHIVWNIRNLNLDKGYVKSSTRWVVKICSLLSKFIPEKIIVNSDQSRKVHIKNGYDPHKFVIIPNGFNLRKFHPDQKAKASVLKELNLSGKTNLVGLVARHDPIKDHENFINASGIIHKYNSRVHFLLCGYAITRENEKLVSSLKKNGILNNTHMLGERNDIPRITAALDIAVSSSAGEAFSNTIGEAMSCGVPCVVTDVGDSAYLVGQTGRVVPPHNHQALAKAILELLKLSKLEREKLGKAARQRIQNNFEISKIALTYRSLYQELISKS